MMVHEYEVVTLSQRNISGGVTHPLCLKADSLPKQQKLNDFQADGVYLFFVAHECSTYRILFHTSIREKS